VSSTPAGGTSPYTYWWSTSPTQTNQAATGLLPGIYTVCVTDSNGCQICGSDTVTYPVSFAEISSENFIKVYPNPFHTSTFVHINSDRTSLVQLSIYDMMGKEIQKPELVSESAEIMNLSAGMYILKVIDLATGRQAVVRLMVD